MAEQSHFDGTRGRFDGPIVYPLAVLVLLAIGGGVFAYLLLTRQKPAGKSEGPPARLVRVFEARKTSHRLAISAYGTSRAAEVWTAITEITGRAVEVNPRFEPGETLAAGTLLVRIDRTDYELARDRYQAEAEAKRLQIDELNKNEEHLREILKLQDRQLELAAAEYERQRKMYARKAASQSALEAAENAYVTQRTTVQRTNNSLSLVALQRLRLTALLKAARAQLEEARRDLQRCRIRLPLDARCASKSLEVDQFVTTGERLGRFLSLETAEVVAWVEPRKLATLLRESGGDSQPPAIARPWARWPREIGREDPLWRRLRIPVKVSWELGPQRAVWWGRLARIESSLDPATRTVGLIIEVRNPYQDVRPGVRPPLVPDVFCEITAYGPTLDDVVVIPRDALHSVSADGAQVAREGPGNEAEDDADERASLGPVDCVYLLDIKQSQGREERAKEDKGRAPVLSGRLRMAEVTVAALEEDSAVISKGIERGDFVILTDLFPAGEGMRLRGKRVDPPVGPRGKIDLPDDLFEDVPFQEEEVGADPPGGELPADQSPAPAVSAETK